MATSRSVERTVGRVKVLLYSGRPDPEWSVTAGEAAALLALWARLRADRVAKVPAPALGYRGCIVRMEPGDWQAFAGAVTHRAAQLEETRADPTRSFERATLATAPAGLVPAEALPPDLR